MKKLLNIKRVFLDLDGTIYQGNKIFPVTSPFLDFLRRRNIQYTFLTNNSSFSIDEYVNKLNFLGISASSEDFYTSVKYTIDYLQQYNSEIKRIYILGMQTVISEFLMANFVFDDQNPEAVVVAFDRTLTFEKLCRAAYFIRQGIPGFATHPDVFCPTDLPKTWQVDCGAITKALEMSTGKKLKILGKPNPEMLQNVIAKHGECVERCLVVGDQLSTDIALGINAGALTCWIAGNNKDQISLHGCTPDFTVFDLGELQSIWENEIQYYFFDN